MPLSLTEFSGQKCFGPGPKATAGPIVRPPMQKNVHVIVFDSLIRREMVRGSERGPDLRESCLHRPRRPTPLPQIATPRSTFPGPLRGPAARQNRDSRLPGSVGKRQNRSPHAPLRGVGRRFLPSSQTRRDRSQCLHAWVLLHSQSVREAACPVRCLDCDSSRKQVMATATPSRSAKIRKFRPPARSHRRQPPTAAVEASIPNPSGLPDPQPGLTRSIICRTRRILGRVAGKKC